MFKCRSRRALRCLCGGAALWAGAALLCACREGGSASAQAAAPPASAPGVTVTSKPADAATFAVRRETLRRFAPAVGSFRARQTTRLGPQVSGRVEEVRVDVGDVVSRGQILVRIDPTFFEIEVQQNKGALEAEKGALASATADVESTEREMRRQRELFESGAGSTKERDDAVTAYERAVGTRAEKAGKAAEAQKKLEWMEEQLEETRIRAPYDGAITARHVDPGQPATSMPPTQLLEIQEVGVLYLEFCLPQELLGAVAAGTLFEFDVEGVPDGADSGTVAVVFPAIDELTRSFRCRAAIENLAGKYQPGLLARVRVVVQEVKDALVVPRTALSRTTSGWQALVAVEGRSVPTPVDVGVLADDWAEVLGGLAEGDRVVAAATGRS